MESEVTYRGVRWGGIRWARRKRGEKFAMEAMPDTTGHRRVASRRSPSATHFMRIIFTMPRRFGWRAIVTAMAVAEAPPPRPPRPPPGMIGNGDRPHADADGTLVGLPNSLAVDTPHPVHGASRIAVRRSRRWSLGVIFPWTLRTGDVIELVPVDRRRGEFDPRYGVCPLILLSLERGSSRGTARRAPRQAGPRVPRHRTRLAGSRPTPRHARARSRRDSGRLATRVHSLSNPTRRFDGLVG